MEIFLRKRYSILFSISSIALMFALHFYVATQNVYVLPWSTKYDILSYLNWSTFTFTSLICILFSYLHWQFCEKF